MIIQNKPTFAGFQNNAALEARNAQASQTIQSTQPTLPPPEEKPIDKDVARKVVVGIVDEINDRRQVKNALKSIPTTSPVNSGSSNSASLLKAGRLAATNNAIESYTQNVQTPGEATEEELQAVREDIKEGNQEIKQDLFVVGQAKSQANKAQNVIDYTTNPTQSPYTNPSANDLNQLYTVNKTLTTISNSTPKSIDTFV